MFDEGRVVQIGAPEQIYRQPATAFAASFVGDANVLPVEVCRSNGSGVVVRLRGQELSLPTSSRVSPGEGWLVLRPQIVRLSTGSGGGFSGVVRDVAFRGAGYSYRIDLDGLAEPVKAEIPVEAGPMFDVGSVVDLSWQPESTYVLSKGARPSCP